eukprot:COSAG01_NODE_54527_length_331_cov_1.228448_1_plen_44_part_01
MSPLFHRITRQRDACAEESCRNVAVRAGPDLFCTLKMRSDRCYV